MRVLIVYESMFGSTHRVAEAIAGGAAEQEEHAPPGATDHTEVAVRAVSAVQPDEVRSADVLVVGAPTHAHGLSRAASRAEARRWSEDEARHLRLEPGAVDGIGMREFLRDLDPAPRFAAAFDTRMAIPEVFAGSAARREARALKRRGTTVIVDPESFLVDSSSALEPGQLDRARRFGRAIAAATAGLLHTAG